MLLTIPTYYCLSSKHQGFFAAYHTSAILMLPYFHVFLFLAQRHIQIPAQRVPPHIHSSLFVLLESVVSPYGLLSVSLTTPRSFTKVDPWHTHPKETDGTDGSDSPSRTVLLKATTPLLTGFCIPTSYGLGSALF